MTTASPSIEIRQVGFDALPLVGTMNRRLFNEKRIINRFDRPDVIILVAYVNERPVGFKIGYGLENGVYYSAKGGVLESHRRQGVAARLLSEMMKLANRSGYARFSFDTFPNIDIGMTLLAIREGFVLTGVDYSEGYNNYRFQFARALLETSSPREVILTKAGILRVDP